MPSRPFARFFTFMFILVGFLSIIPAQAHGATIFGPQEVRVGGWHVHVSGYSISSSQANEGLLVLDKTSLDKSFQAGFVLLNWDFVPLGGFLRSEKQRYEQRIQLKKNNRLLIVLFGEPGAPLEILVESNFHEPPEASLGIEPPSIQAGQSATLTWSARHSESVTIEPDVGAVDTNGSLKVSPEQSTTYTLTAHGPGGAATDTASLHVIHPAPSVTLQLDPEAICPGESTTLFWKSNHAETAELNQSIGQVGLSGSLQVSPTQTTQYVLDVNGPGGTASASQTLKVLEPPKVNLSLEPDSINPGVSAVLSWNSQLSESCFLEPGIGTVETNGSLEVSPTETSVYTLTAQGPCGKTRTNASLEVIDPNASPTVSLNGSPLEISQGDSAALSWTSTKADRAFIDHGVGPVEPNGSLSLEPQQTTTYTITVGGDTGAASDRVTIRVLGSQEPQPEGSFGSHYEDLAPEDATLDSYDPERFALVTGHIVNGENTPLQDIAVRVPGHPEYGTARSNAEGRFALPVEGGGSLVLEYTAEGFLPVQRRVEVPWNDFAIVKTVCLIQQDQASTRVTFDGSPDTIVTHISSPVSDEFGKRSCSLVFRGDNDAYALSRNGTRLYSLPSITVRATEYQSFESMPAHLPPTSAFTYCAELSADGVDRIEFAKPVTGYVDNFLGFEVGEIVPVGSYDRDRAVWVPEKNGLVVMLLDSDGDGTVDGLDGDGDGIADDLDGSGSVTDEVKGLEDSETFVPGRTYWRFQTRHFTPWDCNWPWGPPEDSIEPNPSVSPISDDQIYRNEKCKTKSGSYVHDRGRILHENLPIPGTEMTLHYTSNRVTGYKNIIHVPASGESVPASLKRIIVKIHIAGNIIKKILDPLPNQKTEFVWNGLDCVGKKVESQIKSKVYVGFVYDAMYHSSSSGFEKSFSKIGEKVTLVNSRKSIVSWKKYEISITPPIKRYAQNKMKGWSFSQHHAVNFGDVFQLIKGSGEIKNRYVLKASSIISREGFGYSGDGGPAFKSKLNHPSGIEIDRKNNIFIADEENHVIRKINMNGTISTVAGNGVAGYSGDGGQAIKAKLDNPVSIVVDRSGCIYVGEEYNHCIRKIDPNGVISTIAGHGEHGSPSYEGPARQACFVPEDLALDDQGNIYIADTAGSCVRKVDVNGNISTVAGDGSKSGLGDGGQATLASLYYPTGVDIDKEGNIYIADRAHNRIRKVTTEGIITTVAGKIDHLFNLRFCGDGGPAINACLIEPYDVVIDNDGSFYIADGNCVPAQVNSNRIRKVNQLGVIYTVAGDGKIDSIKYDTFAQNLSLYDPVDIDIDNNGNLYVIDQPSHRIIKISLIGSEKFGNVDENIVFIENKNQVHIFNSLGYHQRTLDPDTGNVLYEFEYCIDEYLTSITNQFGNKIRIDRDSGGAPYSITSPDGLTTQLNVDAFGHLSSIILPDGSSYSFEYSPEGLLTAKTGPNGNRYEYRYDSTGRLTDTVDETGGHWQFNRAVLDNGTVVNQVVTGEDNVTEYRDRTESTGRYVSHITGPAGGVTKYTRSADGLSVYKSTACGLDLDFSYALDPEYKYEFIKDLTAKTPSGLARITRRSHSYDDSDGDKIPDLISREFTVNGRTTTMVNDVLASTRTLITPEGRATTIDYDPETLAVTELQLTGLHPEKRTYDAQGKMTSLRSQNRETTFNYGANGYLASMTGPMGLTITYARDALGRVTEVQRPDNSRVSFTYDGNGNMLMLTNPDNNDHDFDYNSVDKPSAYYTPMSGSYSFAYDAERKLTRVGFPSGQKINSVYDKGRLISLETPEGSIDYAYALCGNKVERISRGGNTLSYAYDGPLVISRSLKGLLDEELSFSYDSDFRIRDFTYAGQTEGIAYDRDGLMTSSGEFSIARNDGNGLPEKVEDGYYVESRSFNGFGEIDQREVRIAGSEVYASDLTRNQAGQIAQKRVTVNGQTRSYGYSYDDLGRLSEVTRDGLVVEDYDYAADGTRIFDDNNLRDVSRSLSFDAEDRLLTAGSAQYQFDADGFLTKKTIGSNSTLYDYSLRGELLRVDLPGGTSIEYTYDPLGRRIARAVNGTITRKYLWQGLTRLLAVYDGSSRPLMRFEYADGRMPVAMTKGASRYYLIYDQVGSLRLVADNVGNIVKDLDYDSFGNVIRDTNPSFEIPFGFAGGLFDKDTGLIRFGRRDYDPDSGRWTAKDPILFAGGDINLYGYCLNDPVNLVDPEGLENFSFVQPSLSFVHAKGLSIQQEMKRTQTEVNRQIKKDMFDATYFIVDNAAETAATQISYKRISQNFAKVLSSINFFTSIFDPFPAVLNEKEDKYLLTETCVSPCLKRDEGSMQ